MGLDYENTIGRHVRSNTNTNTKSNTNEPKPVATYWLNIGYQVEVDAQGDEDSGVETRFVSLAQGIALDTLPDLPTNSSNKLFRELQSARNDLKAQLLAEAQTLKAGEERLIGDAGGLQFQLRRVNDAKPEIKAADNPFSKKLAFAA